ncbi:MAG: NAD(P)/FAD-dependent oxidoreductase [Clostridiales Family XIII bacterium]|jgi:2,4-dienoyl-CoA reductase-like NADH-dependent reductase (Old Yellow Enzyme family)/thioredoxin reductase|nr:NAD(P)/FAD-dependent oxidoreductase [Clostridiales Family XIII bacterium]
MEYNAIFSPMRLGKLTLKNRLIMAPMSSEMSETDGFLNDKVIRYYAARARGGFSVVTTEYIAVQDVGKANPTQPLISDDKYIPGLTKLVQAIKKHGCYAMIQLQHSGRQTGSYVLHQSSVAPSVTVCPMYREAPRELTTKEVYDIVDAFVKGAVRAQKAGFDIIELHAAHGYLLNQFLSPLTNKRIDEFGGGVEGRTYIVKLIIEGIKEACGSDYPISVRCDTVEGGNGGYKENLTLVYAKMFESFGADAFHITGGSASASQYSIPSSDFEPIWNIEVTKKLKEILSIPVIAVGRYNEPQFMEMVLSKPYADLIAVGRQSIADPDFPNKLYTGNTKEIMPCVSCNSRCTVFHSPRFESIGDYGLSCFANPFSADRPEFCMKPAEVQKKVLVVGAGPAGLEAAWVSAARGHSVELYEKKPASEAGGQLLTAAYPPFKQALTGVIRYHLYMCDKHGVKLVFEKEVDEAFIKKQKPDVVFIATGSKSIAPVFKGAELIPVSQANDVVTGKAVYSGSALIIGGGQVGLETADYCMNYCNKITVVEMLPQVAAGMDIGALRMMNERFRQSGKVDIHVNTKVLELTSDGAICQCGEKTVKFEGYTDVIYAMGSTAYNPFKDHEKLAAEVYVVGDATKARAAAEAFFEAAKIAVTI